MFSLLGMGSSEHSLSDAQKIKDEYWKHHGELAELERKHTELQNKLSHDFGPDGAFLALYGR